jgi:hypothetical protein
MKPCNFLISRSMGLCALDGTLTSALWCGICLSVTFQTFREYSDTGNFPKYASCTEIPLVNAVCAV